MSINTLLNVARNALSSYQLAIDVTGGNIANVSTPGYSRQRVVLAAKGNVIADAMSAQISVEVKSIERIFDTFTELQVTEQKQKVGFSETKNNHLQRVEVIFDEVSGNKINDIFAQFWNAWSELSVNPSGQVERDAVLAASQTLAATINSYGEQIYDIQKNIDKAMEYTVAEINSLAEKIASINKQISMISVSSGEANLLLDERAGLLREFSYQVDCHFLENANGSINIYLPDGTAVVEGEIFRRLALVKGSSCNFREVVLEENPHHNLNTTLSANAKGVLGAHISVRDNILTEYMNKMDDFAKAFMDGVNEIHTSAYDSDGNRGVPFFVLKKSDTTAYARNITVNRTLISSSEKIAASATVTGDGKKAAEMVTLKDKLLMNDGTATLGEYYSSLVGQIGRNVATAMRNADYENTILQQLTNQRESISGVSLEEEMMNLVKFQLAYSAAGKLCQVADDLMESLLESVQ